MNNIKNKQVITRQKPQLALKAAVLATALASSAAYSASLSEVSLQEKVDTQIVGGTSTVPYSKPYQVALLLNGQQGCGGTLISSEWVLTAAHCLGQVSTNSLTVKVGAHSLRSGDGQTHRVSQIITHEHWRSGGYQTGYDIGLLRLATPADSRYTPAKLPTAAIENQYAGVGSYVTVSGWGLTSNNGSASDTLREVALPVLSNSACSSQLQSNIPGSVVCGGGPNGTSACNGDSGGPYAVNVNGEVYSIGTVSWGRSCQGATAFTRTSSYTDWIKSKTGIGGADEKPVARFSSRVNDQTVTFTDASTDDRGVVSYSWNFGDNSQSSSAKNPSHYYAQTGDYIVTLTVTDTKGQTGSTSNLVTVDGGVVNPGCDGVASWNSSTIYALNDVVSYQSRKYKAVWWSAGAQPDIFSNVWQYQGECSNR